MLTETEIDGDEKLNDHTDRTKSLPVRHAGVILGQVNCTLGNVTRLHSLHPVITSHASQFSNQM